MAARHFLRLRDLDAPAINALLDRADRHRANPGTGAGALAGRVLVMLFEKKSTRTRVSFEAGMAQMGGHAIFLSSSDSQMSRGETISDTAKVISSMADAVMMRTVRHCDQEQFAAASSVPVINGLSDLQHPCQTLADILTYRQLRGDLAGATFAWCGDASNVCASLIDAAALLGFSLRIAAPAGYRPDEDALAFGGEAVKIFDNPQEAAAGADCLLTDVWTSMGDEKQQQQRQRDLAAYQVDARLLAAAAPEAIFMHCLPAHRGEEVAAEVIDSPASAVWQEAENRLHVQKALLELLIG